MAYLMLELVVCVFVVVIFAIVAFMLCAAVLLIREMATRVFRTLQKAARLVAHFVLGRGRSLEGGRKVFLPDIERPLLSASIPTSGARQAHERQ
jgi:hypothetical protein